MSTTIGTIKRRDQVGLRGSSRVIWNACPDCGKEKWSQFTRYLKLGNEVPCQGCSGRRLARSGLGFAAAHDTDCLCHRCKIRKGMFRGPDNPTWKGGRKRNGQGYIFILLSENHPLIGMAGKDSRLALEHRIVMAQHLGRALTRHETVHHRNGIKDDNRIENLELWIGNHGPGMRFSDYHCPGCRCTTPLTEEKMDKLALRTASPNHWEIMREQASVLLASGFLPQAIKTVEQAVAIILTGTELGIPTMAALRSIDVIQGKPSVSPQLMLALIKRSGQLEDIKLATGIEGASCIMKRKGHSPYAVTFGPKEAKALGLDGKDNYKKQAPTMYQWRAVAAAARAVFPDVILGLYTPDEMGAEVDVDSGESVDRAETVNIVETPPAELTAAPEEQIQLEIQNVCALLNEAGDEIKWTGATLKKYIAENFNNPKADEMTPAMYKGLLGRLKLRLDNLNSVAV